MPEVETKEKDQTFEVDFSPVTKVIHDDFAKLGETMNATFSDLRKIWEVKPGETKEVAPLNESLTGSVKKAGNQVIPGATGGFAAIVLSEVIDGVLIKQQPMVKGIAKFFAAAAVYAWGKKIPFMGEAGRNIFAGLLIFDGLRDVTPISSWASQLANKISGVIPIGGLGDQRARDVRRDVVAQANRVVDYYGGAFGR